MTSPPVLPHLRAARELMDRAYAEPLDLDALAREAGYSRYHFLRAFRAAYGETPRAYLSRRRIERAKDLLRAANLTVTEICVVVGFSSLGSFSSRFRALVGCSPSEYREAAVRQGGAPAIPGCVVLMWTRGAGDTGQTGGTEQTGGREQSGRSVAGQGEATVTGSPSKGAQQ